MRRLKSVVLILVILMSLLLTGCGAKTPTGDLPTGVNTAGGADSGRETDELKSTEQNADQQGPSSNAPENARNSQGASPSQSQPAQPNSTNQESKLTIAIGSTGPNSSSSGTSGLAAVPAPAPAAPSAPDLNANPTPPSPDPKPNSNPNPNPNPKNIVTFSITCQTAVDKGLHLDKKYQEVVPVDGIILAPTVVEFKEGEVVFDVLKQVVRQHKIHMEFEGSKGTPYIQGINNLYEFDGGPLSGWMYCVNKVYPNYGCGEYKLKPGDIIEWNYTCDLGKDLGQTWLGE